MYQVNFLPWRMKRLQARCRFWMRLLVLQTVIFLVGIIVLAKHINTLQNNNTQQLTQLQAEEKQLAARYQHIQQAHTELHRQQLLHQQQQQQQKRNQAYFHLLEQVAQQMPVALWLTALEEQQGKFVFTGISHDDPTLTRFVAILNNINGLKNIQLLQVNASAQDLRQFILQADWQPDEMTIN